MDTTTIVMIVMVSLSIIFLVGFGTDTFARGSENMNIASNANIFLNDNPKPYILQKNMPGACPCDDSYEDRYYEIQELLVSDPYDINEKSTEGYLIGWRYDEAKKKMISAKDQGTTKEIVLDSTLNENWRFSDTDLDIINNLFQKLKSKQIDLNEDLAKYNNDFTEIQFKYASLKDLCLGESVCTYSKFEQLILKNKKGIPIKSCKTSSSDCYIEYKKALENEKQK